MHRVLLEACLPGLIALAVACALAVVVARLSGARLDLSRLRRVHRCEQGGVQSLAFVLTFPLLLAIVLFIVQVSQLMIGLMVVNYAAFASARAASVWIPALVQDDHHYLLLDAQGNAEDDSQNKLIPGIEPAEPYVVSWDNVASSGSAKLDRIWKAAVLACVSICPSRDLPGDLDTVLGSTRADDVMASVYASLVPSSQANARMPLRIRNKLAYSFLGTAVRLEFADKNSAQGPTYNPIGHPWAGLSPVYSYVPEEVGWEDPVTITVTHNFALLPGPGRLLARMLVRADGQPDTVSPRIFADNGWYYAPITGSATMTIEGLQSTRPFIHEVPD